MRDPEDKRHFWEMLQGLAAATKGGELTAGVLKVYWLTLKDMPLEAFDKAVAASALESGFFPAVSELRTLGGHGKKKPEPPYLRPIEDELERIETCQFHVKTPAAVAPAIVPWCRKCKRLRIAGQRGGEPRALGEMLRDYGMAKEGSSK